MPSFGLKNDGKIHPKSTCRPSGSQYSGPMTERTLALDLGIGSYGIALQERTGEGDQRLFKFPIVRSCTLPEKWASLEDERRRRRMYRTRQAHKARELWLQKVFKDCGLEKAILLGRQITQTRVGPDHGPKRYQLAKPGDYRLEREFPPSVGSKTKDGAPSDEDGARTVYCGAALRCLLLLGTEAQTTVQGRPLEAWQVYKAFHSVIQKRGYDPDVPWASKQTALPVSAKSENAEKGKKRSKAATTANADSATELGDAPTVSEEDQKQQEEEQASRERANAMRELIESLMPGEARFHHPCFWEAYRMGIWSPQAPSSLSLHCDHHALSAKWADHDDPAAKGKKDDKVKADAHRMPAVYPRSMVERELLELCAAAENLLPALAGKAAYIAYGPPEISYPNIPRRDQARKDEEQRRQGAIKGLPESIRCDYVRGKQAEWQAALGQKAPTFDNRCVGSCALIPDLNVAKVDICRKANGEYDPDSLLAAEVSFLLQLKNFRFVPELKDGRDWLSAADMRKLHSDHFAKTVLHRLETPGLKGAITKSDMCRWLEENIDKNLTPKPGQDKKVKDEIIEKPRRTGRSRFSRPALRILRALLFSGLSPQDFKARLLDLSNRDESIAEGAGTWGQLRKATKLVTLDGELNHDPKKGLPVEKLGFFENLGSTWEKLSIRDERLEAYSDLAQAEQEKRDKAILDMISREINPRIRHRLLLLNRILDEQFMSEDTRPDHVVLEFARDEFMGRKSDSKEALLKFQNQRRDDRLKAREALGADASERDVLKWQLCQEQGGKCLFCGKFFSSPLVEDVTKRELSLDSAEAAHIIADTDGGPRAYMNLVLACQGCNRRQGILFHADAFQRGKFSQDWDSFVNDVRACSLMRPFKKKLLTTKSIDEAREMVQKRTALQETAWIAKLSRTLICLKYGWPLDFEGQQKKIVVVTGAATNRVATRYKLYRLLGESGRVEQLENKVNQCLADIQSLRDANASFAEIKKARKTLVDAQLEVEKKCRDDKRHHALDAMILSFLPHWAGDPSKNLFFGLPKKVANLEFFQERLDHVAPEELRYEKPVLRETIYGLRKAKNDDLQAVIRRPVLEMAFAAKSMEGELMKFGVKELRKALLSVRDDPTRNALKAVADEMDNFDSLEAQQKHWLDFCSDFRLHEKGPIIKKVSCWSDKAAKENYENLAKDRTPDGDANGRGQWRCAKGSHKGQWLYLDAKSKPRIKAVKVFESIPTVKLGLQKSGDCTEVIAFLQSGCVIEIKDVVVSGKQRLVPGRYRLGGIQQSNGQCDLRSPEGSDFKKIPITSLLNAGFWRVA
jgi:CRISPR-associated endonuclease Csn1